MENCYKGTALLWSSPLGVIPLYSGSCIASSSQNTASAENFCFWQYPHTSATSPHGLAMGQKLQSEERHQQHQEQPDVHRRMSKVGMEGFQSKKQLLS